ncbi:MAG: 4Fe-4S binding protein [Desulfovermiculus sp.]
MSGEDKEPHVIDASRCIRCGICLESCKFGAVRVEPGYRTENTTVLGSESI